MHYSSSHAHNNTAESQSCTGEQPFQKLMNKWFELTGPATANFSHSIVDQERLRRSHLLSTLFPLIGISIVLFIPSAVEKPIEWISIVIIATFGLGALILNRNNMGMWSGIVYILGIDIALTILMLVEPNGIRNSNIPDFDLFVISTLLAGLVFPRWTLPILTAFHISLILAIFTFIPHDPLLTQEIKVNQNGLAFSELTDALLLQITCTTIAWLSKWSIEQALLRVSRAEELEAAHLHIHEQNLQICEQKQKLDYGIHVLQDVLTHSANKDYSVRAKLQDNELVPLAVGLNLMIERLSRVPRIEQENYRLEHALQQLLAIHNKMIHRVPCPPYHKSGTMADQLYPLFENYQHLTLFVAHSHMLLENIRRDLLCQKTQTFQLNATLTHIRLLAHYLSDDTHTARLRPNVIGLAVHEEAKAACKKGWLPSLSPNVPRHLEQQIELIEESLQRCTQIQEIGLNCLKETKSLDEWSQEEAHFL